MEQADSLSRRENWMEGVEGDNENKVMLKKKWLEIRAIEKRWFERAEEEIIEKIKKLEAKDDEVVKKMEEIKKVGVKVLEWQFEGELVLKKRKVYVLKDERLRLEIIWLHYDILIAEHEGQ